MLINKKNLIKNNQYFFHHYFNSINKLANKIDLKKLNSLIKIVSSIKKRSKIIFIGNGGSASIANHCATDFSKILRIPSITFNEPNLITCFANDYGHENWMKEALKIYANKDDLIILISSSGASKNIINCAHQARKMKLKMVTFSGFKETNPLKKIGNLNFWVNSNEYNHVEMVHHVWILSVCDYIKKKAVYND